jgi:hypothetical protein
MCTCLIIFLVVLLIILIIALVNLVILGIPSLYLRIYCRKSYKVYKYILENVYAGTIIQQETDFIQIKYPDYMVYIFPNDNGIGIYDRFDNIVFTDFHRKHATKLIRKIYEHFGINNN